MVRTVSDSEMTELPDDEDLWAALRDRIDPSQPGRKPFWVQNLLTLKPFQKQLIACIELPLKDVSAAALITHCAELQQLRLAVKKAYIFDLWGDHTAGEYPKKIDQVLRRLDREIDMHRLKISLRAGQIGVEVEERIAEIEHDEPLGMPLWLPDPPPQE